MEEKECNDGACSVVSVPFIAPKALRVVRYCIRVCKVPLGTVGILI